MTDKPIRPPAVIYIEGNALVGRHAAATVKTGQLRYFSEVKRTTYLECVDCLTVYQTIQGATRCNGHVISLCPWCRPDSKPYTNGRGE